MFRKFDVKEDVATNTKVKSSVQRAIRTKLLEQMPLLSQPGAEPAAAEGAEAPPSLLEVIWPKKEDIGLVKCREHVSILALKGEPLFFQHFDDPDLLPHVQVDKGAIKFVLSGANIMCPGLTSKGGRAPDGIAAQQPVAIQAEGKEHACAVGFTKMSTADIKSINKGIGIDNIHYLGDDLWSLGRSGF